MKITTDLLAVGGLVVALVVGVVLSAPLELLTGIVGGLSGYISKAAVAHFEDYPHETAREKQEDK